MTRKKLNEHIALLREMKRLRTSRDALRAAAEPGAQVLSGMPHAPGYEDRLGNLAAEIADLSMCIERLEERVLDEEAEIIAFINEIPDAYTRTLFRLRFIRGMSWGEVASVIGGNNSAHSVRSVYRRFFSNCEKLTTRDHL